jgi:hypothetical protein
MFPVSIGCVVDFPLDSPRCEREISGTVGTLDLSRNSFGDAVSLTWIERGGPAVFVPADTAGLDSMPVRRNVSGHLAGSIDYHWAEGGLIVTLQINRQRLVP